MSDQDFEKEEFVKEKNDSESEDESEGEYEFVDSDADESEAGAGMSLADRMASMVKEKKEEEDKKTGMDLLTDKEKKIIGSGSKGGTKRLQAEFLKFKKMENKGECKEYGIRVELTEAESLYKWYCYLSNFPDDKDCNLKKDLAKYKKTYGIDEIKMLCVFPSDYPFSPPFIRVLTPRFQFMTGRVTIGGSICFELLTPSGWMASYDMEAVLIQVRQEIIDGNPKLDFANTAEYSEYEAKAAFDRMVAKYGWGANRK